MAGLQWFRTRSKLDWLIVLLALLFVWLQYVLWFSGSGMVASVRLRQQLQAVQLENQRIRDGNAVLLKDIADVRSAPAAIEEQARHGLGMVGQHEHYYRIVHPVQQAVSQVPMATPAQSTLSK